MTTTDTRRTYPLPPAPRWAQGPEEGTDPGHTCYMLDVGSVQTDLPGQPRSTGCEEILVQVVRDDDAVDGVLHVGPEHVFVADMNLTAAGARRLAGLLGRAADIVDGA